MHQVSDTPWRKSKGSLTGRGAPPRLWRGVMPKWSGPTNDRRINHGSGEARLRRGGGDDGGSGRGGACGARGGSNAIGETRDSLIQQGTTPEFVIAFRGPATRLFQTDLEKIKPEDRSLAAKIAMRVNELSKASGVVMQQCSVAVRQQEVKPENVLPAITVIGNSWISLMAYQTKGFAYIHP